jgi:hypothetical protein
MSTWQPIETAPRDGSIFLAKQSGEEYAFVHWRRPHGPRGIKRWFVVGSWGVVWQQDRLCDTGLEKWNYASGQTHPGWNFVAWTRVP